MSKVNHCICLQGGGGGSESLPSANLDFSHLRLILMQSERPIFTTFGNISKEVKGLRGADRAILFS